MAKLKTNNEGFSILEVLLILLALVIIGAAGWIVFKRYHSSSLQRLSSSATRVVITRDNSLRQPGVSNFSKTVSGTLASTLLNDIKSLKPVPGGPNATYSCPSDDGVDYTFAFTDPSLTATASATGCRWVTIHNKSYLSTDSFWSDVSKATGQPIDPNSN